MIEDYEWGKRYRGVIRRLPTPLERRRWHARRRLPQTIKSALHALWTGLVLLIGGLYGGGNDPR